MSWEDYEMMPWKLGWKHEYWDGRAHITPRLHVMCVVMDVQRRPVNSFCPVRPLLAEDQPEAMSGESLIVHEAHI